MADVINKPIVNEVYTYKEVYIKKCFLIFNWYTKVYDDNLWVELVINTGKKYNKIIINWEEFTPKS